MICARRLPVVVLMRVLFMLSFASLRLPTDRALDRVVESRPKKDPKEYPKRYPKGYGLRRTIYPSIPDHLLLDSGPFPCQFRTI